MKTVATVAAAIMIMSATAWAGEPIELSDAEMDGVTAGSSSDDHFYLSIDYNYSCTGCSASSSSVDGITGSKTLSATGGNTNASSTSNHGGQYWFGDGLQPGIYK